MAGDADVTYSVITSAGHSTSFTLESLEKRLSDELNRRLAFSPIKRIVKVTREDIELPDFVIEYNKQCREAR